MNRGRLALLLAIALSVLPGCPHYEICAGAGVCPDVAVKPAEDLQPGHPGCCSWSGTFQCGNRRCCLKCSGPCGFSREEGGR